MTPRSSSGALSLMANYDVTEGTILMKRLAGGRDRVAQEKAANALRDAVKEIIETSGSNFSAEELAHTPGKLTICRGHTVICRLLFDHSGVRLWEREEDGPPRALAIEYHADVELFVGTEDDTFRVPVPGKARERRSAVAVVISELIEVYRGTYPTER